MINSFVARRLAALLAVALVVCTPRLAAQVSNEGGDPPDSGYESWFLSQIDRTNVGEDEATLARLETIRETRGMNPGLAARVLREAANERARYPFLMPGASAPRGVPPWRSIGPVKQDYIQNYYTLNKTDSGRLRTILPHPTKPDIVYVLASSGGLWKTKNFTDRQPEWSPLTDGVSTTSGGSVALGRNPNTIYLGLGDPFDGNGLTGGVMLKSSDGGATWSAGISLPTASSVRDVKTEWYRGHDIVYVATDAGIYVSQDDGLTYNLAVDAPLIDPYGYLKEAWSIAATSTGWVITTQAAYVGGVVDGLGEMVFSNDHGATWKPIANTGGIFSGAGRTTLGVGAPGDRVVYAFAAIQGDYDQLDLFRSTNGGQSWTALGITNAPPTNPNDEQPTVDLMYGQAFYNQAILVDPRDASRNTVYIGGQLASARTTDGGATFTITSNWLAQFGLPYIHADFHAAAFLPNGKKSTIAFGSDGGLFTSPDGGTTWDDRRNIGLVTTLHYSISSNPLNPASGISGLQDNGTFVRKGHTKVWNQPLGGDGFGVGWSQANQAFALGSIYYQQILSSSDPNPDNQDKFNYAFAGIDRSYGNFFTAIFSPTPVADQTGQAFFTYTNRQIYATTNGGQFWNSIGHTAYGAVPPSPGIGSSRRFRDTPHGIGVSPVADGRQNVAVACNSGWVVYTHDGGSSWHQTLLGAGFGPVPNWQGFNTNVEWADDNTLYVTSGAPIPAARVAKSTDGGVTFSAAGAGLPDVPVNRVLVNPMDRNMVFAATYLGVYRSTDGGATFARFGAGLPFVEVRDLYMPPNGKFLRVATYGRGIWELRFDGEDDDDHEEHGS